MWASSTSYCKLPFFRLHSFHFWKGGLVTLNPGRRRAGRLGGGRSPRLCDLESLGSLRRSGDGKVYQTQSQSETTGKAADLPRLAESTKHDTFDIDFRRSRAVDVDLDVVLVVGKLQPGRWREAWRGDTESQDTTTTTSSSSLALSAFRYAQSLAGRLPMPCDVPDSCMYLPVPTQCSSRAWGDR